MGQEEGETMMRIGQREFEKEMKNIQDAWQYIYARFVAECPDWTASIELSEKYADLRESCFDFVKHHYGFQFGEKK